MTDLRLFYDSYTDEYTSDSGQVYDRETVNLFREAELVTVIGDDSEEGLHFDD